MSRVTKSPASRKRRKKVLKQVKGARGARGKLYRSAVESLTRSLAYSYRDRKQKKREFRKLWIARISATCKERGISYSKFINGLNKSEIKLDRKILSDITINDTKAFDKIVEIIQKNLSNIKEK